MERVVDLQPGAKGLDEELLANVLKGGRSEVVNKPYADPNRLNKELFVEVLRGDIIAH